MLSRRRFILMLAAAGGVVVGTPARGTQSGKPMLVIGSLNMNTPKSDRNEAAVFRQALQERGWVADRNIRFEPRHAEGRADRLPALANELVQLGVDVILTTSPATTRAVMDATTSIPIVMTSAIADEVASLARPGGNVTGVTYFAGTEIAGKQLELLKELTPRARRVAVLSNPGNASHTAFTRELKVAAHTLGTEILVVPARYPDQLPGAFAEIAREGAASLLVLTDSMFFGEREAIAKLAADRALPSIYGLRAFVDAGGLASYGPNITDVFRRAANHVDKILRGTKPSDLPVEQPTKFELVINLKTARMLRIAIPQSMLLRADDTIR